MRAAASWGRVSTLKTTARPEPAGPRGGGRQLGDGALWRDRGDRAPPRAAGRWVGAEGRGWVLNATSFGLWWGGGPLREAPGVKMQKERERRGLSLPLSLSGEVLGGREEGGQVGAHREHGSEGRASTGLARLAVVCGPEAEIPVVTRECRRSSRKTTWFPPLGKMRPLPATASQGKSPVPP